MDKINSRILNQLVVSRNLQIIQKLKKNLQLCKNLNLEKINLLLNNLTLEFENIEISNTCDSFDMAYAKIILKQNNINLA
jgi:hypothetical protein